SDQSSAHTSNNPSRSATMRGLWLRQNEHVHARNGLSSGRFDNLTRPSRNQTGEARSIGRVAWEGRLRAPLAGRFCERAAGVLSCYDRIIVTGSLPGACYADGMTAFLSARQVRIFDYPRFAEPLRDRVRERAAELAAGAGISIEHIA